MDDQANPQQFGQIIKQAQIDGPLSPEQLTKQKAAFDAENQRKRDFLKTFRRWVVLFRRRDGDIEADRWLIAEYFRALGHLSPYWLDKLTDALIRQCTFFPSIAECLKLMECGRYDYAHPFHGVAYGRRDHDPEQLGTTAWHAAQIEQSRQFQIEQQAAAKLLKGPEEPTQ